MIIIKALALFLLLFFISYRIGMIVNKWLKRNSVFAIILYGFVTLSAMLQILYIPFILLHVSFSIVFFSTIIVIGILTILSFYISPISKDKIVIDKIIKQLKNKKNVIISSIVIFLVLFQGLTSSFLFNENADDSFYVSLMQQNIDSNSIYTTDPSTGINNTNNLTNYMISGYELGMSVISKIMDIPVTTLCHTIWIFIMIVFSYMAYYLLLRKLLNNKNTKIAIILLAILFLFSGFTTRFRGMILLSRMWQGKEIFLNIILTLIISNLVTFYKYNVKRKTISLIILNISAIFFTNTAIFLVPFTYLGFAIIQVVKKKWKNIFYMFITGIPIIVYGIIYLANSSIGMQENTNVNIVDVWNNYIGTGYYHLLYAFSIIIIFIKGNKRAKQYFIVIPIIYLLTIYNPMLTNIIVKYFTTASVFWRLFWLLPIEISIVNAFILLIDLNKCKYYKNTIFVVELICLILLGRIVYSKENGFDYPENLSKIPKQIVMQTNYILDKEKNNDRIITVLAPPEPMHSATMRQLTSRINIFWPRNLYMNQIYTQDNIKEMEKIHCISLGIKPDVEINEFENIREKYNVNWIIINDTDIAIDQYLENTKYKEKIDYFGCLMYQY